MVQFKQKIPVITLRYAILVMVICFLPHIMTAPWWLSLLAILVVFYRLTAEYQQYPMLPSWFRALIVIMALVLLRWQYHSFMASGFFIGTLLTFFWLKIIEVHSIRDVKIIVLASIYVVFAALVTNISLWVFPWLALAIMANIILLFKLELPSFQVSQLGFRSMRLLGVALPVTLVMFFIFPRFTSPLWVVNLPTEGQTAFKEEMSPGTLSSVKLDNSTAMQVRFNHKKARPNLYWYGLVLSTYDGVTWKELPKQYDRFVNVPLVFWQEKADYEVILEPHYKRWLFYLPNPVVALPGLKFSTSSGLMTVTEMLVNQRFSYAFSSQPPVYRPLSPLLLQQNLQLPEHANPRLKVWATEQKQPFGEDTKAFVDFLLAFIHQQPYWYTLQPKPIGIGDDQLDRFWFDTREGYCEYYASAMAFILRASGVPARVILGYYRGEWNPLGQFLNIRQRDAHAWVEYWQPGSGWVMVDPSAAISSSRIDRDIQNALSRDEAFFSDWSQYRLTISWFMQFKLAYASVRFFWERWILFYNQDQQQSLLKSIGLDNMKPGTLFQIWVVFAILFLFSGWFYIQYRRSKTDPLKKEYAQLQKAMSRYLVHTLPPATLARQWQELAENKPELEGVLRGYLSEYENLRLRDTGSVANKLAVQRLFKRLRKQLQAHRLIQGRDTGATS